MKYLLVLEQRKPKGSRNYETQYKGLVLYRDWVLVNFRKKNSEEMKVKLFCHSNFCFLFFFFPEFSSLISQGWISTSWVNNTISFGAASCGLNIRSLWQKAKLWRGKRWLCFSSSEIFSFWQILLDICLITYFDSKKSLNLKLWIWM